MLRDHHHLLVFTGFLLFVTGRGLLGPSSLSLSLGGFA